MKVNILDAHDRLKVYQKQGKDISECCQDLVDQRPFGDHPFYAFNHARTEDNSPGRKRYIWLPWLLKPEPVPNTSLLKLYPGSDMVKVIWIIPTPELWGQYSEGNVTESKIVRESIEMFKTNRMKLMEPEIDDPDPETAQRILFEYQPQLFKRETLPKELQPIWDQKMRERRWKKRGMVL